MNKQEILQKLADGFSTVDNILCKADDAVFYLRKDNKWSIAENCNHLSLSVKPLNTAFSLPNFALLFFGQLNRPTREYDEIKDKYYEKIAEGVVATSQFIPAKISVENNKQKLIDELKKINGSLLKKVEDFTEEDLDKYLIPHPVLGKLTIREMLYFTICHTLHHQKAILFQQN
jgi:hypothetical protein